MIAFSGEEQNRIHTQKTHLCTLEKLTHTHTHLTDTKLINTTWSHQTEDVSYCINYKFKVEETDH